MRRANRLGRQAFFRTDCPSRFHDFMAGTNAIEISFLGGAGSIGASCMLVRAGEAAFVVDCGIRYSGSSPLPDLARLADVRVEAVLLTHAHMDHSGGLPVLAEACPAAPVFATAPTIDLVGILLRDSVRLMNSPEREAEVPLYTDQQVDRLLHAMIPVRLHQSMQVGPIEIRYLPASHILGAAMIHLTTPAGTILLTGDYSVAAQQTVPGLARPDFRADLVVSEATYGQRLHEDRNAAEERLVAQVRAVVERGGRVLIPAFAVGRAQEVLLILKRAQRNGTLPEVPVFVDGMVRAVCDVYRRHESYVSRHLVHEIRRTPHAFYTESIQPVTRPEERASVLNTAPSIIVASSGMLSGGPSAGYCRELARNAADAVLLTGYQDEESPGRALLELANTEGPKELRLGQQIVPVACQFGTYGLSAHADRMQMVSFIEAASPRTVALVHGDGEAKESLARSLRCADVVCARDGMVLERSYPRRSAARRRAAVEVPAESDLDIDRARHLLGPAGSAPLRAAAVAEAWFGQPVDRSSAEQFARLLESVGLVRRDDHRRDRLWVLGVQESGLFPQEAELEEQLKQANPKGRLLELCMRMRVDPPATEIEAKGAFFEARSTLEFRGRQLDSGLHRAASKKTAEQLAARALLELLDEGDRTGQTVRLTEEDAGRLISNNPKGRLLEWCAKTKSAAPDFQQDASPEGYRIRAVLSAAGRPPLASPWYVAAKLKTAEQGAAEWILERLPGEEGAAPQGAGSAEPAASSGPPQGPNAAAILNELAQRGLIAASGYELVDQSGPSHRPTFTVVAWAKTPQGRTLRSDRAEAPSKKAAQHAAASRLLDLLVAERITGR